MSLPIFNTAIRELSMLQTQWASQINPVLSNPANDSLVLKNVSLTAGSNTINTRLGRKLQGWQIVRQRGPSSIYDTQDNNQQPDLTLLLNSSANVSVDILVF